MIIDESIKVSPGRKLWLFRKRANVTQEQLAEAIGYESGSSMISQIEKGETEMSMDKALKAARYLKVHPSVLLAGEDLTDEDLITLNDFLDYLAKKERPNYGALKILIKSKE